MIELVNTLVWRNNQTDEAIITADLQTKEVKITPGDAYYNIYIPLKDFLEFADKLKSMIE